MASAVTGSILANGQYAHIDGDANIACTQIYFRGIVTCIQYQTRLIQAERDRVPSLGLCYSHHISSNT